MTFKNEMVVLENKKGEEMALRQDFEKKQQKAANLEAYRAQLEEMEDELSSEEFADTVKSWLERLSDACDCDSMTDDECTFDREKDAVAELVELIKDVLDADGRFEVRVANNGFDAGMMVKEYHPDIIVLDVMLPDINGREVCQRVRSDSAMDDVQIICISGMVEAELVGELKAAGANDFMHKPFEVEQLEHRMCGLLDVEPGRLN